MTLKNKLVLYSAIATLGLTALTGCSSKEVNRDAKFNPSFDSIESLNKRMYGSPEVGYNVLSLATGDLDGDGDLDVIAGYKEGFIVYENNIPQKNK